MKFFKGAREKKDKQKRQYKLKLIERKINIKD